MYKNLREEIRKEGLESGEIAVRIGLPQERFFCKLRGQEDFTVEEAFQIKRFFFPCLGLPYLFRK